MRTFKLLLLVLLSGVFALQGHAAEPGQAAGASSRASDTASAAALMESLDDTPAVRRKVAYRGELRGSLCYSYKAVGVGADIINGIKAGRFSTGVGIGTDITYDALIMRAYLNVEGNIFEGEKTTLFLGGDGGTFVVFPWGYTWFARGYFGGTLNRQRNIALSGGVSCAGGYMGLDVTFSYKFRP